MEVMKSVVLIVVFVTLAMAIIVCSSENPAPTPAKQQQAEAEVEPAEKQEESSATVVPTPSYTPTPVPTEAPQPTYTPQPTHTPLPTYTPQPTHTPLPTSTPLPTATPSRAKAIMETLLSMSEKFSEEEYEISSEINRNAALYRAGRISDEQVCEGWRKMDRLYDDYAESLAQIVADSVDNVSSSELTLLLEIQTDALDFFEQWWEDNMDLLYACGIW